MSLVSIYAIEWEFDEAKAFVVEVVRNGKFIVY